MERPSHSKAPENQLLGSLTWTSGVHVEGPLKTTMSPGSGSPNQYGTLLTITRSPVHPGQPCSVFSIDPEGMKNACTRNVLTSRARTKAISSRTGSSRSSEPFFRGWSCRRRPRRPGRSWAVGSALSVASGTGSPPLSGTTSAGPTGRSLLIRTSVRPGGTRRAQAAASGRGTASARDGHALLLDLGGLAAQLAEVVQLGPAHVTAGHDLDLLDDRGVHREGPLDADAEAHLADGEGLPDAAALTADHGALEDLDAGTVALDDADVHLDGVAGTELGDVVAQRVGVECVQGVHLRSPVVLAVARTLFGQRSSPAVRSGGLRPSPESTRRRAPTSAAALYCATTSVDDARRPRPRPLEHLRQDPGELARGELLPARGDVREGPPPVRLLPQHLELGAPGRVDLVHYVAQHEEGLPRVDELAGERPDVPAEPHRPFQRGLPDHQATLLRELPDAARADGDPGCPVPRLPRAGGRVAEQHVAGGGGRIGQPAPEPQPPRGRVQDG